MPLGKEIDNHFTLTTSKQQDFNLLPDCQIEENNDQLILGQGIILYTSNDRRSWLKNVRKDLKTPLSNLQDGRISGAKQGNEFLAEITDCG